jgi:hypothetical protein
MKKLLLIAIAASTALLAGCGKEPERKPFVGIEGISFENYPRVDGSTSARALIQMTARKKAGDSSPASIWSPHLASSLRQQDQNKL